MYVIFKGITAILTQHVNCVKENIVSSIIRVRLIVAFNVISHTESDKLARLCKMRNLNMGYIITILCVN
jgi:hypothetical protein